MKKTLYTILTILVILPFIPDIVIWDRWEEFNKNGGCVWYECPLELRERMVKEAHGSLPPTAYEQGTKEWMRAHFNYGGK